MANTKPKKGASGGAQSHIRSRISYLQKAAAYLQSTHNKGVPGSGFSSNDNERSIEPRQMDVDSEKPRTAPEIIDNGGLLKEEAMSKKTAIRACLPRQYISQMRGVSLKSQLRLSVETKRSFCKRCDILLVPGVTCIEETQNASRGRRKPWADVHVTRCAACGTEKRVPATQQRGKKLSTRKQENKTPENQPENG